MSWASNRETTRQEDIAYCLLGIFGISMPLIYGEGKNAFERLQQEIIKSSMDQSIFCWIHTPSELRWRTPFAESPTEFRECGNIIQFPEQKYLALFPNTQNRISYPYSMTNVGLEIQLPVAQRAVYNGTAIEKVGFLNCAYMSTEGLAIIGIILVKRPNLETWFRLDWRFEESYEAAFKSLEVEPCLVQRLFMSNKSLGSFFNLKFRKPIHDQPHKNNIIVRYFGLDLVAECVHESSVEVTPKKVMLFRIPESKSIKHILVILEKPHSTRLKYWTSSLFTDDPDVKQEVERLIGKDGYLTAPAFEQDRRVHILDDRRCVNLAFRKILHEGIPSYLANISLSSLQPEEHTGYTDGKIVATI